MLHVPAPSKKHSREILLIYGHHAMLERWWSLVQNLNDLGAVTMPDLPGFGGMDSFAKVHIKPDIDAYADYLAAFIKLRFKRKRLTIYAISFGFAVVTRMLQRYPELTKKVDILVSTVGFMHKDDFLFSKTQQTSARYAARLFATRPIAFVIRYLFLNRFIIRTVHSQLPNAKRRMIEVSPEEFESRYIDFETKLWQANDVRTHWLTTSEFLNIDNCQKRVDLPVVHVASKYDHYFDNEIVKQHMLVVFKRYRRFTANSKAHTPNILADKKATGVMVPAGLRRLLAKQ